MKQSLGRSTWQGLGLAFILQANLGMALSPDNPYQAIAGRNPFALRPPTPANSGPIQTPQAPTKIFLQGINTILGHKQVLLKVQPPAPGKEMSLVMREKQREGEVEILEIDHTAGIVKLINGGQQQTMTMEKDAAKPAAGAPLPAPALGQPPSLRPPTLPPPSGTAPSSTPITAPPAPNSADVNPRSNLPTRSLRTATATPSSNITPPSLEEQTVMMEVQREVNKAAVNAGTMPPLPPTDITHLLDQAAK